ncbi:hypothetical protein GCM10007895_30730 [Paraferrimonas sedimenticola]|uniref:Uncharacterized protein n=1 Tax=Paraferrimonas sedimenticola TaxID=375674 RepID=A0AA37VZT0_9GAMM|nr:hypothetical protein GCM10007895_30730 [Paraferrimonas sedimenticola]
MIGTSSDDKNDCEGLSGIVDSIGSNGKQNSWSENCDGFPSILMSCECTGAKTLELVLLVPRILIVVAAFLLHRY